MTPREKRLWAVLLAFSLFARLTALGLRAMSHDESLHALYSWNLMHGLNFRHDPMMHGPLLFHLNALAYALLGVTDFTARLIPALLGTACVAMLIPFRRWLGSAGALCAAALVSLDPALLFYSRYLRNDVYIALFTLVMVWAVLRYRESPRPRHLILLTLGLALSFTCKEICFIHGMMLGAACGIFSLVDAVRERPFRFRDWVRSPWMQCAVLIFLLALPFATGLLGLPYAPGEFQGGMALLKSGMTQVVSALGVTGVEPSAELWRPDTLSPSLELTALRISLVLLAVTAAAGAAYFGWLRNWRIWAGCFGLFWGIQLTLFSTLFTHVREGWVSGIAGGLGYWLSQHEVERGNPDPAFYLTLLLLYVPVLILGGLCALRRIRERPVALMLWWTAFHLAAYSWAGERMPWLLLHLTLPLCLLTGAVLPGIFARTGWKARTVQAVFVMGLLQLAANSLRLNGPNAEGAVEPLVYAHTGPDYKTALLLAEAHRSQFPESRMQIDPAFAWPTAWYTRESPAGYEPVAPGSISGDTSVIFAPPNLRRDLEAGGWTARLRVDMTCWPRARYHRLSKENLSNLRRLPQVRHTLLRYYLHREHPERDEDLYPAPNRFLLMTRDPHE